MLLSCKLFHIYLPMAQSLKSKRSILSALKRRLKNNFNISVAEVDNQNVWKNSTIAVSMVSGDKKYLEKQFSKVNKFIKNNFYELEIIKIEDYF